MELVPNASIIIGLSVRSKYHLVKIGVSGKYFRIDLRRTFFFKRMLGQTGTIDLHAEA